MKKISWIIVVLLFILLFTACNDAVTNIDTPSSSVAIETSSQETVREEVLLTQEQTIEDFNYLCSELESNYPLINQAEELFDFNYEDEKEEIIAELQETIYTLQEFYEKMRSFSRETFKGLGHFNVFSAEYFSRLQYSHKENFNHQPNLANKNVLFDEKAVETYTKLGGKPAANPNEVVSPLIDNKNIEAKDAENQTFTKINEQIVSVTIKSFASEYEEMDALILKKWFEDNNDKNIIIDIRGNGGGIDTYWINNIVIPNITEPMVFSTNYCMYKDGNDLNNFFPNHRYSSDFSVLNTLPYISQMDLDSVDYIDKSSDWMINPLSTEAIIKKDIYLIVDDKVASSADAFTSFCVSSGFATVVGATRTYGDGASGVTPIYKMLPNCGLVFSYRIVFSLNADGSNNTIVGTAPDIYSENPIEAVIKDIENNHTSD